ncbi:GNAT family N-acetyltransferase [Hymenobacter lutimineralis]|uniref:GNAT family N-acetyltransferase n=1 Tax=Hymenobacter lutimineralis TaxID=2606448 RepID=A0A5D6VAB7_9BACT|nr:GNAT family N-acetyltransferase [Hymenobacter lutimineralis]TYZ11858.1 GNAT family N-acetyltransferase [Hymenobacter lutimineralis]
MASPTLPVFLSEVSIRPASSVDAEALANLVAELDYPTAPALLRTRLNELTAAGDQVLVAEYQAQVIGMVHLHRTPFLHRAPDGRIVTLGVLAAYRNQQIGAKLLAAAEHQFQQEGCGRVEVTSGFPREAAHRFYQRAGYEPQSRSFVKVLPR